MAIFILTGPSAAGKNAVADAIGKLLEHVSIVDVDDVRKSGGSGMIPNSAYCDMVADGLVPGDTETGRDDWQAGVSLAIARAREHFNAGRSVIVIDVLSDRSAKMYRNELKQVYIVLLLPALEEIERRYRKRAEEEGMSRLGDDSFIGLLYRHQSGFSEYDLKLDNSNLSPEEVARRLASK